VFKANSINQLLKRWSLTTVFVLVLISGTSIYTNLLFSDTQKKLTEKVLPVASLSHDISELAIVLAKRQMYLLVSDLVELETIEFSRQELIQQFELHWRHLTASLENKQTKKAARNLFDGFQQFLEADDQLTATIRKHNTGVNLTQKRILQVERAYQEGLASFLVLAKLTTTRTASNILSQNRLRATLKALEFDFVKLDSLLLRLGKKNQTKSRLATVAAEIKHVTQRLISAATKLEGVGSAVPSALTALDRMTSNVRAMQIAATAGDGSLFQLQYQQLDDEKALADVQQASTETLNQLVEGLNTLSSLINRHSLSGVTHSISIAEKSSWVMIGLTLLLALSMTKFISIISRRVNEPLRALRNAMHGLSLRKFGTRLEASNYADEFEVLATDFNQFAYINQVLIEDLDTAKHALQKQELELRTILNGVPEAIIILNSEGIIESINPSAEQLLNADEDRLLGAFFPRFFEETEQVTTINDLLERLEDTQEFKGLDFTGQPFSMWLSLNPILDENQPRFICVLSDVTAWKKTQQQLKQTSSELDTILENAMVSIAFMKNRQLLRVNHKFEDTFGYSKDEVIGQSLHYLCADNDIFEQLTFDVFSRLEEGNTFEDEVEFVKKNGDVFWCGLSTKAISSGQPEDGTIWIFDDITAQRESEEKLRVLASLDGLTGLPNRSVFNDRLMHAIHKAQRNAKRLAIFFLDLDHFKHINDSLGHKSGDQLLCEVAKRLKSCVRKGDTVARLGGDEFTLILEDIQSVQYVAKIAEKVIGSVCRSYRLGTAEVNVSPSIGVSLYPADGRDVDVLVRNADAAMYHAKNTGRNNFQFYSAEMNAQAAHRLAMETSLRRAVEQKDFYLNFQPQIEINTNKIVGAEVLLRWHSPQWGEVSPAEFIPILEDTGLIGIVGEQVLLDACQSYMSIRDKLEPDFKIAVNLSGRQFKGAAPLAVYVHNVLEKTGMSANNLELEITESILMEDTQLAIRTLTDLSELGATLAVDDFGTGYSSLSYLKQFPINVLKIDKSFIDDVTGNGDDAAIVDAILAMSGHLNLDVVAEGIETIEQLEFLQQRQCQRGQGYYFSRPLNFEAFESLVGNNKLAVQ
jgi:diguanylate cyclase (GGDEF)-like protein/PAS domain S-box-containing protein